MIGEAAAAVSRSREAHLLSSFGALAAEEQVLDFGLPTIGETVPGAKLVLIPQAAHISNVEQAATFNQALRDFL